MPLVSVVLALLGCGSAEPTESCTNVRDDDGDDRVDCADRDCARHCDGDGDGFVDASFPQGDDCDDTAPDVHPGATEVCGGVDDDCDGLVDDSDPDLDESGRIDGFVDEDEDGSGTTATRGCPDGPGFALVGGDCDDRTASVAPGLPEVCDGRDDDCDDLVDADDPDALVETVFEDRDGDGHGNPAIAILGCAGDGWSLDPQDCDDRHATVHALAVEVCDGLDTDCDGALGDGETDGDGDGDPVCTDCDDADPLRSSRLPERCGAPAIDDDCDGLTDGADPSLDLFSCGVCPEADASVVIATPLHLETWNPCVLDPDTTALCSVDPARPDTHGDGSRLHRVSWREDLGYWRDPLFVFLPPGPGRDNQLVNEWAAYAGYRVISLGYPNDDTIFDACTGDLADVCYRNVLYETTYGDDLSALVEVSPADSIVTRLGVLLDHLAIEHPTMGFDRYLATDGTPEWSQIVVAGWSGGGRQSAYLSKVEPIAGGLLMSSPKDHTDDLAPVGWVETPGITPGCALLGAWHVDEPLSAPPESLLPRAWDVMGMPSVAFDLDEKPGETPPAGTHRVSQSIDVTTLPAGCSAHASVGRDPCMRTDLLPAYLYLFCTLDALDPLSCTTP